MLIEKLIVNEADVKKLSAIGGNVQLDKYRMDLLWIQEFQILPLLGDKLYSKIEKDYEDDTLSGVYLTIWKYCRNILARFIAYEYGKIANYNVQNAGVYKVDNNGRTTSEKKEVDFLAHDQKNKGLDYVEKLKKFLCENKEGLKAYDISWCGCGCGNSEVSEQIDWLL